ncbi:MAG: phosphoglycerate dehydrogenase [Synergistaceae bacterium]|jgi:D-3-phosphoglycerate dehydrogenase|nr:phosphoglycerate dehydrogenase [Synergistaceae bacterium]
MKVLVTATSLKPDSKNPALEALGKFADEVAYNPHGRPLAEDELIPLLSGCDGFIAGLDFVTERVINSCGRLKVISRYGAGVDRVDIAAASARGVCVCNTPGANAQAVADLAFGLMLGVARRIPMLDRMTREGKWVRSTGVELYGKTIGILGLGAIGKAVARRAAGFSMKVLAYDPFIDEAYAEANGIEPTGFDRLVREANFISLHLPMTGETRHIIGEDAMRSMKPGAVIVNTARGGLIDEAAAYELLKSGHLGGLGLDAYEEEPPSKSPLLELDNVVMTPHTGAHTHEATANMAAMAVENLIDVLSGRECKYILNRDILTK